MTDGKSHHWIAKEGVRGSTGEYGQGPAFDGAETARDQGVYVWVRASRSTKVGVYSANRPNQKTSSPRREGQYS